MNSRGAQVGREALCTSGAGNRFYLIDVRSTGLPPEAARWTREVCARRESRAAQDPASTGAGFEPDGVLWVVTGDAEGALRMVLLNADGSRPEACGNGLRCLVHWAVERGALEGDPRAVAGEGVVETDGGPREVRWREAGGALCVEVCLGRPRALPDVVLTAREGPLRFARVDLANPHAVHVVPSRGQLERLTRAALVCLGESAQREVPGGTNVELIERVEESLEMRVFERGVGETRACGTGSAAAAWIAVRDLGLAWPVRVRQPGGMLTVDRDDRGRLWLSGPVLTHGSVSFPGAAWATCSTS